MKKNNNTGNTILILILVALGILYYFYFDTVNGFVRTTLNLPVTSDFTKQLNVNDSTFINYYDFEHNFGFKYPVGYYVVKQDTPDTYVSLIHYGSYGDVEYFVFQQYLSDPRTQLLADVPNEAPAASTVQGVKGYYTQSFTGDAVLRNFYFTCSNKNYMIASRIPTSFSHDSDLYYYFIKNFNCTA